MQDDAQQGPDSLLHRAIRFREFGELAAAKDVLLEAVKIAPSFSKAWFLLGEGYEDLCRHRYGRYERDDLYHGVPR